MIRWLRWLWLLILTGFWNTNSQQTDCRSNSECRLFRWLYKRNGKNLFPPNLVPILTASQTQTFLDKTRFCFKIQIRTCRADLDSEHKPCTIISKWTSHLCTCWRYRCNFYVSACLQFKLSVFPDDFVLQLHYTHERRSSYYKLKSSFFFRRISASVWVKQIYFFKTYQMETGRHKCVWH